MTQSKQINTDYGRQLIMRSILFAPGHRQERFTKAIASNADVVCFDLEDGVPDDQKSVARGHIAAFLNTAPAGPALCAIRLNPLSLLEGLKDILWLTEARISPAFIILPKVESAESLKQFRSLTAATHPNLPIFATLETARGLDQALHIGAEPGLIALGFGSADYVAETGGDMGWDSLIYARGRICQAAAAHGLQAIDGTRLAINDDAALEAESRRVAAMGFGGRIAIHPRQVEIVNQAFSPTPEMIAKAQHVMTACKARGGGAFKLDGRMIDAPVIRAAARTLAIAERLS